LFCYERKYLYSSFNIAESVRRLWLKGGVITAASKAMGLEEAVVSLVRPGISCAALEVFIPYAAMHDIIR
jgi:hypothetical protein